MKTIYFIRHAKSNDFSLQESDFERTISKKGYKDINTIGSYLKLRGIYPDNVLSSCALRAQQSVVKLMEILSYNGKVNYLEELYMTSPEQIVEIVKIQDDDDDILFIIGHHPYLTELVNKLGEEHICKIPSMGVVAMNFNELSWQNIDYCSGKIDFFISPKQFKYYMPKQIRTTLP